MDHLAVCHFPCSVPCVDSSLERMSRAAACWWSRGPPTPTASTPYASYESRPNPLASTSLCPRGEAARQRRPTGGERGAAVEVAGPRLAPNFGSADWSKEPHHEWAQLHPLSGRLLRRATSSLSFPVDESRKVTPSGGSLAVSTSVDCDVPIEVLKVVTGRSANLDYG